jgi:hypothetical protein
MRRIGIVETSIKNTLFKKWQLIESEETYRPIVLTEPLHFELKAKQILHLMFLK